MKRREFVGLLGGAAAAAVWPSASRAQHPGKMARVGFLGLPAVDSLPQRTEAFRTGMRDLGYLEGHNVTIDYRWADSNYGRLPALLAELIDLKVDVIVTHGTPGALAAKQATSTIPIVIAVVGDAVASGVVASLAHPGGNVTGLTFFQPELNAKRLELLKEAMPDLMDVGVLLNPSNQMNEPVLPEVARVSESLKLRLHQFDARAPGDFDGAFATMNAKGVRAFVVFDDAMLIGNAKMLAALALKHGLASCGFLDYAGSGGLIAYGVDFPDMFRRSAAYVDKILKGAKPSELPVEQATRFATILNMVTAKGLGLTIPSSLLLRADQVIE
ncbi:MAG TPA: ABC transporter substrate-binding protein [Bradyrhizobium sp.]|jgi:putative ABC transport system substrate-binding protein|nr:ABC transporter substrate-binding protein [Bradyrhizobium sp.]